MKKITIFMGIVILCLQILIFPASLAQAQATETITPLPRIAIREKVGTQGEFYTKDTGKTFHPRGFNHVVLEHGSTGWHALFNVGIYNAEAAEKILSNMESLGTNVVRVWCWGVQKETGFTGDKTSQGINPAYMANVIDFLQRATKHGIYVLPIVDEIPRTPYYRSVGENTSTEKGEDSIPGYNAQYLSSAAIAAKAQCINDFIQAIAEEDITLLNTIFGWSLANEVFVNSSGAPFKETTGTITTATGQSYDLSDFASRQRCWDESILNWANKLADTIHAVDPEALVTAGMWTSDAHARPPVNGLMHDGKDQRFPPRPSVLGGPKSRLDFLEVHVYPWDKTSNVSAIAHERDQVLIPAIVGEYGVFKYNTPEEARTMLKEMLQQSYAMGYVGDLFWVWDLSNVEGQTWSAVEHDFGTYVMEDISTEIRPARHIIPHATWTVSPPIFKAGDPESFDNIAVKDPSIVYVDRKYHLFYTSKKSYPVSENTQYDLGLGYVSAPSLEELSSAKRYDIAKILNADIIAPQVFYFEPQQLWYMMAHQRNPGKKPNLLPIYLTNPDINNPHGWSAPTVLNTAKTDDSFWIDFWIICDDTTAHLFYTNQKGSVLRMECPVETFPKGLDTATESIAMTLRGKDESTPWIAFEAQHIYHVESPDTYLMLVEGGYYHAPKRHYGDARNRFLIGLIADDLSGPWTRIGKEVNDSFAHASHLFNKDGTPSTYTQVSHPELIRSGYNQKLEIEDFAIQMIVQSFNATQTPDDYNYNELPWELSILTNK